MSRIELRRSVLAIIVSANVLAIAASKITTVNPSADAQNSFTEDVPAQTFVVTTTSDGTGAGTFRTAITSANANPGLDTISFNIGSGQQTLPITSNLPAITDPVIIDGTTQPGYAGTPLIRFTPGVGGITSLINITGGGSTIKALSFASFSGITTNNGMIVLASSNNVVAACHSGTGSGNTQVYITGANNRVGGSTTADRNFFYGNTSSRENVIIRGLAAAGNRVVGNVFGTTPAGVRQTNSGKHVLIEDAPNNFVGGTVGTTPGGTCTGECNVLSGSDNDAVAIFGTGSTGNVVAGNYIGMMADGLNVNRNSNYGVHIQNASNNIVGGNVHTARNVIAANTFGQIWVESGPTNTIRGNYIGLKANGLEAVTGTFNVPAFGIQLNSNNNLVGGETFLDRNVISGNNRNVIINGNNNRVRGNYIGTDATGMVGLTTQFDGILINGSDNWIGGSNGTTAAGPCTGACNVISGNGQNTFNHGIAINGPGATGNKVTGNFIGVNAAGTAALRNGSADGTGQSKAILVNNASNNTIGGLPVFPSTPTDVGPEYSLCIQSGSVHFKVNLWTGHFRYLDCHNMVDIQDPPPALVSSNPDDARVTIPNQGVALIDSAGGTLSIIPNGEASKRRSVFDDNLANNGPCDCPPNLDNNTSYTPPQTIVGPVEIGGPNGSTLTLFAGNRVGMTSNGTAPLFGQSDKILVNGTGNLIKDNEIASYTNAIEFLDPNNAAIENDFDGYTPDWTPFLTAIDCRVDGITTQKIGNRYEITITVANCIPNTQYLCDINGKYPVNGLAHTTDSLFDGTLITDGTGRGSITFGQNGSFPATGLVVYGSDLVAAVTPVVNSQSPLAPNVTYGATSRFSASAHVEGPPISGRVRTPSGLGLRNAIVSLINPQTGERRTATSSSFGFFLFEDVLPLRTYTIEVASRRYRFTPQAIYALDINPEVNLVGHE